MRVESQEKTSRLELADLKQVVDLLDEKLLWHEEAAQEFRSLPPEVQLEALQYLLNIARKPTLGQRLENKYGIDLSDCYKVYFDHYKRRIVYEIDDSGKVRIWGIG